MYIEAFTRHKGSHDQRPGDNPRPKIPNPRPRPDIQTLLLNSPTEMCFFILQNTVMETLLPVPFGFLDKKGLEMTSTPCSHSSGPAASQIIDLIWKANNTWPHSNDHLFQ